MAKSISGGLGTVNLSVQELRLLGGTFTTLDTTTLTVLGTATLGSLTINGTFTIDQLTSNTITTQNLSVSQTMNVKADNDNDNNDNKIIFIKGGTDTGILKTSTGLYYNPSTDELRAGRFIGNVTGNLSGNVTATNIITSNITASGTITANGNIVASSLPTDNHDNNYRYIPFQGVDNILHKDTKLAFNPTSNTLDTDHIICETIQTADITASGDTSIKALNNTTANFNNRIPFINGDSTETGVLITRGNFNYNTSTQTLNCGTFNGSLNGSVSNAVTIGTQDITATTTTTDTLNLKAVEPSQSSQGENCRLCFFDGASTTGSSYNIVKSGNLYFNHTNSILVTNKIQGQIQMNTPLFVMLVPTALIGLPNAVNASIGLYNNSGTVLNRYQHAGGHLFMDGNVGNNLIMTNTAQTRIYNELQCDGDVSVTGTLTAGTLNIGTQTATNFSVDNDLTVEGDTILTNTPLASGSTPLSILLLGTNKVQRGLITFNPLSNILSTTNIGLTGNLTSSIVTTTTLSATTLDLSGDLTLTNLPNTISTGVSYSLLFKNNTTNKVRETPTSLISIGRALTGVYIETERIIADTFQCGNGLPLGYTSIYSCGTWATNLGGFGQSDAVKLSRNASEGGSPRVSQYGANIASSLSSPIWSAIKYPQGSNAYTYWGLANVAYAGIWRLDLTAVFQNLSSARLTPKIMIQKLINGNTWIAQPQMSVGVQYTRTSSGELSALRCEGVCYLTTTSEVLRIVTLLEIDTVNNPPTFPDTIASNIWAGREITISMQFLGTGTSLTGEIVNVL